MQAASGMRSVALAGDVSNSAIVTGANATVTLRVDGDDALLAGLLARAPSRSLRTLPLAGLPPPPAEHLDRETEGQAVRAGVGPGRVFELTGSREIGKTFVVRSALRGGAGMPEGSIYVHAAGKPYSDLLQELHEAFHASSQPAVVGQQRIRPDLASRRALVVLDAIELGRDELRQLAEVLSGCALVLVGREPLGVEGVSLRLGGLATPDAMALVEQELGRPLQAGELAPAERVCVLLAGHPFELRQATAAVRARKRSFEELAQSLAGDSRAGLARLLAGELSGEEAAIVSRLAVLRGASTAAEHVCELAGADASRMLTALREARLIASDGPRHRIAGVMHDLGVLDAGELARATAHFAQWARGARSRPAALLAEAPALLELLRRAADEGRDADVIALGRACDAAFAWARRWQTWGEVLDAVLVAAKRSGDDSARAWALHQAGTVAYCLGDSTYAQEALQEALRARETLGEGDPAAATRHNLEFIAAPPLPSGASGLERGARDDGDLGVLSLLGIRAPSLALGGVVAAFLVVIVVLGGVLALALGGGDADSSDFATTTTATEPTTTTQTQTTPVEQFALDVSVTGDGEGTVRFDGRACRDRCTYELDRGSEASLIATAREGSRFDGWTDPCATQRRCTLRVTDPLILIATFTADATPAPPECDEIVDPGCLDDLDPTSPAPTPPPVAPPPVVVPPPVISPPPPPPPPAAPATTTPGQPSPN